MKNIFVSLLVLFFSSEIIAGQESDSRLQERIVTFRFVPQNDMFFVPWTGNGEKLDSLYSIVDELYTEIVSGRLPIRVDGYCGSFPTATENIKTAFLRANRVKSELITHKGLAEDHFITRNFAAAYIGADGSACRDMVVVTLRIPAPEEPSKLAVEPSPETPPAEEKPIVTQPSPEPLPEPEPEPEHVTSGKSSCFAIRTNLLYDAFLVPTLGVEWRINQSYGIKLDVSYAFWGNETAKVQKIWIVNPEFRRYMGVAKRFYMGIGANFGKYNVYQYLIGGFFPDDIGYQGRMWNAGVTAGYQLPLSRGLSLDFNLGLGFTKFYYDSFNVIDRIRIYKEESKTKNFWGPTQAGISLIWKVGGGNH